MGRKRRPVLVGDIIARLIDEVTGAPKASPSRGSSAGRVTQVLSAFDRIGPPVTDHADAVGFRRGVLTLQVHESTWLTELTFLKSEIVQRMNRMLGGTAVREVRLRLGPRRRVEPPRPPPRPLTSAERASIDTWTAPIADADVRDAVRRAAERSLARGAVQAPQVSGPPGPRLTPPDPADSGPAPLKYGYGGSTGHERPGWSRDRWKDHKGR